MLLSQDGPLYIMRGHRLLFLKSIILLSLKIDFGKANSVDPDEMPHKETDKYSQIRLLL